MSNAEFAAIMGLIILVATALIYSGIAGPY